MSKIMTLMKVQMNHFIPINEIKERGSKNQTSIDMYPESWTHF